MKKKVFVTLVLVVILFCATGCGSKANDANESEVSTSQKTAITTETRTEKLSEMSQKEIYDSFDKIEPTIEIPAFSEMEYKCIKTVEFTRENEKYHCTWDIYIFMYDGLVGTAILNDSGESIFFYGNILHHTNRNSSICLVDIDEEDLGIYIFPQRFQSDAYDQYRVVTEEI